MEQSSILKNSLADAEASCAPCEPVWIREGNHFELCVSFCLLPESLKGIELRSSSKRLLYS